ncbi:MAG: PAS domain-containing sensor histidine kinase [Gemmatimonadota bacterium]
MPAVAVVVREGPGEPPWAEAAGGGPRLRPAELAGDAGRDAVVRADCALVDAAVPDPAGAARRVHAADPALQVLLVAPAAEHARLRQSLLFAPGLGEVWLVDPAEVHPGLVDRAAGVTGQRRRWRATRAGVERSLAAHGSAPPRRTRLSDAYLASLLQALPDPVASIADGGEVVSWNPAAERVLGRPAHEAAGRPLAELLAPADPAPLHRLLEEGRREPRRGEVAFRRAGGEEGIAEVIVAPVDAGEEGVRCVIVHDLTEERQAQAELESQAAELQEQAAELEMLNDQLQARTRQLESALETRSRFYAAMSHELRTPINAVLGFNDLLLAGVYGPLEARQEEGLARAQRAARHLLELVNDVLDLAKIEAGRIDLQVEPTAVGPLLAEMADTVRSVAEQHGSRLEVADGPTPCTVHTDPRRVRQIVLNLLSNAAKFGDGKPILLDWSAAPGGGVEVRVVDHGRGIAPEHLQRIFDEFEQVDPGRAGGTGLGLPISLRLARLLGGSLRVESAPGAGSTFTLRLPAEAPAPPPAGAPAPPQ